VEKTKADSVVFNHKIGQNGVYQPTDAKKSAGQQPDYSGNDSTTIETVDTKISQEKPQQVSDQHIRFFCHN
jgi:hypothetical protein